MSLSYPDRHAKRELCPDCGAVDADGQPTACQQGCPASYLPHISARRRKPSKTLKWRSVSFGADVSVVAENMDWLMALPDGTVRVTFESGMARCLVKVLRRGHGAEIMRRLRVPGFGGQ